MIQIRPKKAENSTFDLIYGNSLLRTALSNVEFPNVMECRLVTIGTQSNVGSQDKVLYSYHILRTELNKNLSRLPHCFGTLFGHINSW